MTALSFDDKVFNREVSFCRVYSLESKEKLEKLFLRNRISYFIEWQDRSFLSRLLKGETKKKRPRLPFGSMKQMLKGQQSLLKDWNQSSCEK